MAEEHMFSFGGDDIPEELMKLIQNLARGAMDTGLAHDPADNEIMPSKTQLSLEPGDTTVVSGEQGSSDTEFVIARLVNPEDHAETFPDYEDRLMGSYVLCSWYSRTNLEGSLGWIPRSKLVKVEPEHFDQMISWINLNEVPSDIPPKWMVVSYANALAELAEVNEYMPQPIQCGCGSYAVTIELIMVKKQQFIMGLHPDDRGKSVIEAGKLHEITQFNNESEATTYQICWECESRIELPQEIGLYG